jgi:nitroreductase
MDTLEAIRSRRSVHDFEDKKVENEKIGVLIESVRWAPSAGNKQPWEIIVLDDKKKISALSEIALEQNWIKKAPLFVVICINQRMAEGSFGVRGKNMYALQSTAAAVQNMMLAATDIGLATCWVDVYDEEKTAELLGCPEHVVPIVAVAVGYAERTPEPPLRHEIPNFAWYNTHGQNLQFEWKGIQEHLKGFRERLIKSLEKY